MTEFIERMEMAFIATSDSSGECDCSFRAGPAGFIRVLDDQTIAYPEYRGNGVLASLGNVLQNPHIGILLVDFSRDLIGLHVNGDASIITPERMAELDRTGRRAGLRAAGRSSGSWCSVTEAYVHCSKHIPKLIPQSRVRHWGTDNPRHKGGDYFGAAASKAAASPSRRRPWTARRIPTATKRKQQPADTSTVHPPRRSPGAWPGAGLVYWPGDRPPDLPPWRR